MHPARVLAAALLLLTTPLFADRRELEPPVYGPSLYGASDATVAYAAGRFLTVWSAVRGSVWGVLHDADGRQITEHDFPIPIGGGPSSLHLFADGNRFVLIWKDPFDGAYITEIDRDGKLTSQKRLDEDVSDHFAANFDGNSFLILPDGKMLDRTGQLLTRDVPRPFVEPMPSFAIADGFLLGVSSRLVQLSSSGAQIANTECGCALFDAVPLDADSTLVVLRTPDGFVSSILERDGTLGPFRPLPITGSIPVRNVSLERFGPDFRLFFRTDDLLALTLDSTGAPRESAPVVIAAGVPIDRNHAAASSDRVTLVVQSNARNDWDVHAYTVRELAPTPPSQLVIAPAMQIEPILAPCGSSFVAAWTVVTRTGTTIHSEVHYAALDAEGIRTSPIRSDPQVSIAPALVSNGNQVLLIRQDGSSLIATRVGCSGEKLGDTVLETLQFANNPIPGFPGPNASAAWTGTHWLVVWVAERVTKAATLSAEGALGTVRPLNLVIRNTAGATRQIGEVAVAAGAKVALLVFEETESQCGGGGSCTVTVSLGAVRLSLDGMLIDATAQVLPAGNRPTPEIAVASDGTSDFRVAAAGLVNIGADERELRIGSVRPIDRPVAIHWDGTRYILATSNLRYIYLETMSRDGVPLGPRRVIRTAATDWFRIAATPSGDVLLALEEFVRPERVVAYSGDDATPIPAPPQEPTSMSLSWRPSGAIEVTWTPPARTDDVDGYFVETWWQGALQGIAWVGPEVRSKVLGRGDRARVRAYNAGGMSGDGGPRRRLLRR